MRKMLLYRGLEGQWVPRGVAVQPVGGLQEIRYMGVRQRARVGGLSLSLGPGGLSRRGSGAVGSAAWSHRASPDPDTGYGVIATWLRFVLPTGRSEWTLAQPTY